MGVFSIVALASVFKVEELLRKIFGIAPTRADHQGALKTLARFNVLRMGKNLIDNVGKVTGGIGKRLKARGDFKKANDDYQEERQDILSDPKLIANPSEQKRKLRQLRQQYEKQRSEIKEVRKEGLRDITSGFAETGGGIIGGTTGALFGMADGDFSDVVTNAIAGASVGDSVAEQVIKDLDTTRKNLNMITKNATKSYIKEYKRYKKS